MTRSDRDIERDLAEWLDNEARPMPQHVLESSLEAVSRSSQVGGRQRYGFGWFNQRSLAMGAAATVVILLVLGGSTILANLTGFFGPGPGAGPTPPAGAQVWDPAVDFLEPPNQQNPSPDRYGNPDVWGYLRSWDGRFVADQYVPLPNFDPELRQWYERDLVNLVVSQGPGRNEILLHGWSDGVRANNRGAILAWHSPISGSVTVTGTVETEGACSEPADGVSFSINRDEDTLQAFHLGVGQARSFSFETTVEVGQTIYFVNDPGGDARCDPAVLVVAISNV